MMNFRKKFPRSIFAPLREMNSELSLDKMFLLTQSKNREQ